MIDGPGYETGSVNRGHHAVPIVTEPSRDWAAVDLRDILAFREVLYFLIWRDIKVRYKQTAAIGVAWVILQPFMTMGALRVLETEFRAAGEKEK